MDTHICMAESLFCPPETIPALFIGYTPIQNKKFGKMKKQKERGGRDEEAKVPRGSRTGHLDPRGGVGKTHTIQDDLTGDQ